MAAIQDSLRFFALDEDPFAPAPDPFFFFSTNGVREILQRIWDTMDAGEGACLVLGEDGFGKTMLVRRLLAGMALDAAEHNAVVIGQPLPTWSSLDLLAELTSRFHVRAAQQGHRALVDGLERLLAAQPNVRHTCIIDEAHNLYRHGQLELLHVLSRLEDNRRKLLNIVLLAQPEWVSVLQKAPHFASQIVVSKRLAAWSAAEAREAIGFRLRQAGADGAKPPEFTAAAIEAVHAYAQGNPRETLTLCRSLLLEAAGAQVFEVDAAFALRIIDNMPLADPEKRARAAEAVAAALEEYEHGAREAPCPEETPQEEAAPAAAAEEEEPEEEGENQALSADDISGLFEKPAAKEGYEYVEETREVFAEQEVTEFERVEAPEAQPDEAPAPETERREHAEPQRDDAALSGRGSPPPAAEKRTTKESPEQTRREQKAAELLLRAKRQRDQQEGS